MNAPLQPPRCLTRWTGGSVRVVDAIVAQVPAEHLDEHGHLTGLRLVDPFVGGGSVFFALQPQRAILSDACEPLIRAWRAVQVDVGGVVAGLEVEQRDRGATVEQAQKWFLATRERMNDLLTRIDPAGVLPGQVGAQSLTRLMAVHFFALMRSGYSGLWRVNEDGAYNVGFDPGTATRDLVRADHLRSCSALLQRGRGHGVYPIHQDFRRTLAHKGAGDLIYADSPFVDPPKVNEQGTLFGPPSSESYTGWTAERWGPHDTTDLWKLLVAARDRGAHIIHQNHDHPTVRAWAREHSLEVVPLEVHRSVSCDAQTRGAAREVLVVGRPA